MYGSFGARLVSDNCWYEALGSVGLATQARLSAIGGLDLYCDFAKIGLPTNVLEPKWLRRNVHIIRVYHTVFL